MTLDGAAGGALAIVIPAGALTQPTTFSIIELNPNTAPGAVGSAFRIEPRSFASAKPITLLFTPPPGVNVAALTAAHQDTTGYWFRVYSVHADASEQTVVLASTTGGDWSLVTRAMQQDLYGPVRIEQNQGLPFVAEGSVVLQYVGEYATDIVYVVTGSLNVQVPVAKGAASCSVDAPNPLPLRLSVAEIHKDTPARWRWGLNGQWNLTCDDGTTDFISTNFDTLGITNLGCSRRYSSGAELVDPTHVRGRYVIDCGGGSTVTGAWDLVAPGMAPGPLP